ncbi:MAG: hypothetical protein AAF772_08705 [Acidobacteriota bacterium]
MPRSATVRRLLPALLLCLLAGAATLHAQITVDGVLNEMEYSTIATKANANSGFGPDIDVSEIVYHPDNVANVLHIGVVGRLNTGTGDGIGLFLDLSGVVGTAADTLLGDGTVGGFHFLNGDGGGSNLDFRSGFETDVLFAVRPINGTDADLFIGDRVGAFSSAFVCQAMGLGTTSCTASGIDVDGDAVTGSITFAFNNAGGATNGLEMAIDYDAIGADPAQTLQLLALVVSETGFFSDVTVPGDVTGGNPGFNPNFSTLAGGPYGSMSQPLPVELTTFTID